MDFRVKKGTKLHEVYYEFLQHNAEDNHDVIVKFFEDNRWWFSKFNEEAREQCMDLYQKAKAIVDSREVDAKLKEFWGEL